VYWGLFLGILPVFHGITFRVLNTAQICVNQHKTSKFLPETRWKINKKSANSRSIFDRYFNPLVFWYQWEYHGISTFTSKEVVIFCRVSGRLAMNLAMNLVQWLADWQTYRFQPFFLALAHHDDWEFPPLRVVETRLQVEHRRRAGNVGHSRSDRSTALNPDRRKPPKTERKWSEMSFSRHINCHYYNEYLICVFFVFLADMLCGLFSEFDFQWGFNDDWMGISWDMTIGMSFSQYC